MNTELDQARERSDALLAPLPRTPLPDVIDLPPQLGWAMWDAAVRAQDKGED